jgi:hypothetical protein
MRQEVLRDTFFQSPSREHQALTPLLIHSCAICSSSTRNVTRSVFMLHVISVTVIGARSICAAATQFPHLELCAFTNSHR